MTIEVRRTVIYCEPGKRLDPSLGSCQPILLVTPSPTQVATTSNTTPLSTSHLRAVNISTHVMSMTHQSTPTPPQPMVARCSYSSCSDRKATRTIKGRVCYCDDQCNLYRDCCHDTKHMHVVHVNNTHSKLYDMLTCVRTNFESKNPQVSHAEEAYLMVSACSKDWVTSQKNMQNTVKNCTESFTMPLTDPKTNFVFRNIHCALCNNVSIEQLSPWQPRYDCSINTTLDAKTLDIKTLEDVMHLCRLEKYTPPSHTARTCFPHVSSCSNKTSSNTSSTTADCSHDGLELYQQPNPTGKGYVSLFRNRHCAVCNDVRDISCFVPSVFFPNIIGGEYVGNYGNFSSKLKL